MQKDTAGRNMNASLRLFVCLFVCLFPQKLTTGKQVKTQSAKTLR